MVKETEVSQFNNIALPSLPPFYFPNMFPYGSHMLSNNSSLFVSISNFILQYNMDIIGAITYNNKFHFMLF
jgi:hypothetical protein